MAGIKKGGSSIRNTPTENIKHTIRNTPTENITPNLQEAVKMYLLKTYV